jgi:hypothetical protein
MIEEDGEFAALDLHYADLKQKIREAKKSLPWRFEPQHAVDMLFANRKKTFQFEQAAYLYMFLIWCIRPDLTYDNEKAVAASVALNITTQITFNQKKLKGEWFNGISNLAKRLDQDWYKTFYSKFVRRVGGIGNALNAPSLQSEDEFRKDVFAKLRREMAIIEYIEKSITEEPRFAMRIRARDAFRDDVLWKGSEFYKSMGGKDGKNNKRTEKLEREKKSGKPIRGLSKTAFDDLWDDAPSSIVLLYVLQDIIGPDIDVFFADPATLKRLDADPQLLGSLRAALCRYEMICRGFEAHSGRTKTAKAWHEIKVPTCEGAELLTFTAKQLKRFDALRG